MYKYDIYDIYIYTYYLPRLSTFHRHAGRPQQRRRQGGAALQKQQALQAQQEAAEAEQRRRAEAKALAQQDGVNKMVPEMVEKWWISMDFYEFSVASCGFGHSLSLEMVGFGWFWWIFWLDYLTKNVKLWDGGCLILFNDFSTKRGFWQWCDL